MDLYTKLQDDHREIKQLMEEMGALSKDEAEERKRLAVQLQRSLLGHAKAEEATLYKRLDETGQLKIRMMEAHGEHTLAESLVKELAESDPSGVTWGAKFMALKKALEHHIEMEEGPVFEKAREILTSEETAEMLSMFEEEKERVMSAL